MNSKEHESVYLNHLKAIMNDFLRKNYRMTLNIPVNWSGRMTANLGKFTWKYKTETKELIPGTMKIVLSKKLLQTKNKRLVEAVAKHEALHYALYILGKPYSDGSNYFESELKKHGLESTSNFSSTRNGTTMRLGVKKRMWVWTCPGCGKIASASYGKTRKDYSRYMIQCCKMRLVENGWQELDEGQKYLIRQ